MEAKDIPDKTVPAETIKEDAFTTTCEVDQSNLLVNILSRFAKPMHKFNVKEEKKEGECWWMLMQVTSRSSCRTPGLVSSCQQPSIDIIRIGGHENVYNQD